MVLEAMKMEHLVRAERDLRITEVLVAEGDLVADGVPLFFGEAADGSDLIAAVVAHVDGEDWAAEVAEIARRKGFAAQMGGPDKVARQHDSGRLTVRDRIGALADPGSFLEIGALTGFPTRDADGNATSVLPANFVAGTLRLDGRKVVVGADDFTVRGGSGDAAIHAKQIFAERYAGEMRLPMLRLLDGQSGGGSVKMAQDAGHTYLPLNPGWDAVVDNLSLVPVVAACLGPTVGLGAARLVMSHLAVMVEGVGQLFTAGPPVVRSGTGEALDKEQLGGAAVNRDNGSIERIVATEEEAFEVVRAFLSYLPTSVFETPLVVASADPVDRREEALLGAIPRNKRRPYAITPILEGIFDAGSVFPYAEYGGSTVTALARLAGHPVGVIAADPLRGATMSVEGALAVTRLVDLCETFHLPIVSLTDQAGMAIGSVAERRATIRHGARAISAVYQSQVPQAELILRRVYGIGGAGIVNRHRASRSWAWPSGDWGSLPIQGGVEAAFRAQIDAAEDPAAETARLAHLLEAVGSPFRTAEKFGIQDLIDPRDSRALLCDWVEDAYRLLQPLTGRPSLGIRP
jgi:acetyl-CoA carboxylase carboxyltransferase component